MKSKKVFITDREWFESGALKNPIITSDHELEKYFPFLYSLDYDTKLLTTETPTKAERESAIYNDYRDKYGTYDLTSLDSEISRTGAKNVFLNGFDQELFNYIAPLIKNSAETIYFFKCPKISDLSVLSQFSSLKCVHIFHNNSPTNLWDMSNMPKLKVISFSMISKLNDIDALKNSFVEYVHLDGTDNCGHKKSAFFKAPDFEEMPKLKYLSVDFENCRIEEAR